MGTLANPPPPSTWQNNNAGERGELQTWNGISMSHEYDGKQRNTFFRLLKLLHNETIKISIRLLPQ